MVMHNKEHLRTLKINISIDLNASYEGIKLYLHDCPELLEKQDCYCL